MNNNKRHFQEDSIDSIQPRSTKKAREGNDISCSECNQSWDKNDVARTYFQIPCKANHIYCPICFSTSMLASKGLPHFFSCKVCATNDDNGGQILKSWQVHSHKQSPTDSKFEQICIDQPHYSRSRPR